MIIPIQRDSDGSDGNTRAVTVTRWSARHLSKRKITLLTFEYLEIQEGVGRAYKQMIQLRMNVGMCQKLADALLKMVNGK